MTTAASGFTVDARVCTLIEHASAVSGELLVHADEAIAATHGFAAPVIAALVATLAAWVLREAWRGLADAPFAVVALGLAAMVGAVVAAWPGTEVCDDLAGGALLSTPLAILVAGAAVVGCWHRPGVPDVVKIGLAAMVVSGALSLLLARTESAGGAAPHLILAVVAAGAGAVWLSARRTRTNRPGEGHHVVEQGDAVDVEGRGVAGAVSGMSAGIPAAGAIEEPPRDETASDHG